uniref:Synaptopodin n=1 Tax=Cynoglossus semilaevis TaxID=244447 RepID=A0A3P8WKT6_CYNSE
MNKTPKKQILVFLIVSLPVAPFSDLTRSASLSEKELKDARVRSHLIASQLTVPSNSNSRGVQLFNRRKQRVSAFTLESSGGRSQEDKEQSVKTDPSTNKPTCAERNSEENDRNLNLKNGSTKILSPSPLRVPAVGDIMEEPNKNYHTEDLKDSIILERHFLPVKEEQEEEIQESKVEDEVFIETKRDPVVMGNVEREAKIIGGQTEPAPFTVTLNGCHSTSTSDRVSTIVNRTARPFFSPPPVQSPEATSPTMGIPPPPSYDTPPLPAFTAPQPVTFSPPPPPPSYPTPPLPAFTNQPPQAYYTSPPPMSPVKSPTSPPPSQIPASSISRYPPMPHYGPPTAPKPSTSAPEPMSERKTVSPIKTGVLEDGTTRRAARKSMFTFKEKPVVAPNPELLSLVQGVDEKKKHQHRSVPEPTSEEELMALGAEASNFLAKEEARVEEAKAPEWTSCLKSSRTKPRAEHRPEQNLTNVSGKGAELFAKRQSRMEKYVIEKQDANKMRAPSPTMSLPPSWVYPSNMPGRVKAIPAPEPLENGCSKIEMDLSRHQPYQIDPSLFTFSPVQEPLKYLPKRAPQKNQKFGKPLSRHASLPSNPPTHYRPQCMSPQQMPSPRGGAEREETPVLVQPRISSAMAVLSPERESSPRCAIQAPRPTFCAKKAGLEAQVWKPPQCQSPMTSPTPSHSSLSFSTTKPLYTSSATSPISPSKDSRCMSPIVNNLDSKPNHRLLAKNIINAAKRKNSPSPGALSGHSFPISPLGNSHHGYDCQKSPTSPFQSRALGARSPIFTSPPPTPTQRICSPVRLYNTRSLTDSDASIESEDSGLRSPGLHSYNTCPRGWGGSLRVKRSTVSTDL